MKNIILTLLICISAPLVYCQLPYSFSAKSDIPITVGSVGVGFWLTRLDHKVPGLTEEYVNSRNPEQVWAFDRLSTRNWRPKTASISDKFLYGSIVLPFTLVAAREVRRDYGALVNIGIQTFAINFVLTGIAKLGAKRTRPYVYNSDPRITLETKMDRRARSSFYSGHTSTVAAMSILFAKAFTDTYPDSNANPYIWASSVIIPAGVGFMRVHAGRHFLTDVIVGLVAGVAVGYLVPQLHR